MKQLLAKWITPLKRLLDRNRNFFLFFAGLGFWAGCVLAFFVETGLWLRLGLFAAVVLFAVLALKGVRVELALVPAFLVLGMLYTAPHLRFRAPETGTYAEISGYVYGAPREREDSRITFTLADIRLDGVKVKGKAYCSAYFGDTEKPELFDGAKVSFPGRVYIPDEKSGEPRFDFRGWLMRSDMCCGVAISQAVTVHNTPETAPWKNISWRLRDLFTRGLESTMGDEANLAAAMLLGEREGVSEQEYAAFQKLGIAHVMAVSGLHVALLGAMVMALLRLIPMGKGLRYGILAVFLLLYSGLTGFNPSSLRAAFMLLVGELCLLENRRRDSASVYGLALILVLLADPVQATSASMVLSFAAVGGIVLFMPAFDRLRERLPVLRSLDFTTRHKFRWWVRNLFCRLLRTFANALMVSLAAQLGTLLPVMCYYHSLPVYGLLVNMLAVPYMGLLLPVYGIALLTCFIPWVGTATGAAAALMSRALMWMLNLLERLPYASLKVATPSLGWIVCGIGLMLCLAPLFRKHWKPRLTAALVLAVVAVTGTALTAKPVPRYVQLAVGQGDAAMLFTKNHTVAIDVGADGTAVMDYLADSGSDLDALILTHLHLDHAGGVSAIVESGFHIGKVYLPIKADEQRLNEECLAIMEIFRRENIPVYWLSMGDRLEYDGVTIDVLWPDGEKIRTGQNANDLPLVLSIDLGGVTLFQASDLTGRYEMYCVRPCDVLKVAHHGSWDSTSPEFLEAASPGTAIVTCASGRQLPAPDTLQRLHDAGITTFRTDEDGDITIRMGQRGPVISPWKP